MPKNNIWYVEHPLDRYKEDAKALARAAGLRIVDANVVPKDERENAAEKPPKLTIAKPGKEVALQANGLTITTDGEVTADQPAPTE